MTFYRKHERVPAPVFGVTATKQSFKDECDINNILKKYLKTGLINHVSRYNGRYEDLPDTHDYQEALQAIMDAEAAFESLPARVRRHFGHDPSAFLEAVNDPERREELIDLGLVKASPVSTAPTNENQPAPATPAPETSPAGAGARE